MNLFKNIHLCLLVSIAFSTCVIDRSDPRLKIINSSKKSFYYILKTDSTLRPHDINSLTPSNTFTIINYGDTSIPVFALLNTGGYEEKIKKDCLDSTLYVYTFEVNLVEQYDWDNILRQKRFSKKGFKINSLDSLKWFIDIANLK